MNITKEEQVEGVTRQLLQAIQQCDWDTYDELCDGQAFTCIEPETRGSLVAGMAFHKHYFDLPKDQQQWPRHQTLCDMQVRLLGKDQDVATCCYRRLIQVGMETVASSETRVWEMRDGDRWVCTHCHRS